MNNLTESELEQLDRLIRNEISDEEKNEVIHKINTSDDWKQSFEELVAIREVSRRVFHQSQKQRFRSLDKKGGALIKPLWFAIAAAGALLVTAALWLLPDESPDRVLAEYRKFPNVIIPIEKSASESSPREKAYQAYELSAYQQAITRFNTLPEMTSDDSLFLALSYFETREYEIAGAVFELLASGSRQQRTMQVAEWYSMWIAMHLKDYDKAKSILRTIASTDGHRYNQQAKDLLSKF